MKEINLEENSEPAELPVPDRQNAIGASPAELPVSDATVPSVVIPHADELPLPRPVEIPGKFDGSSTPQAWIEELQRRANYPFKGSPEYLRALAEASKAARRARTRRSEFALSSFEWNPHFVALIIAVLFLIGMVLWAGCQELEKGAPVAGNYAHAIKKALAK